MSAVGKFIDCIKVSQRVGKTTQIELLGMSAMLVLILFGLVLTALIPLFNLHNFGEAGRLARDGGLAYMLVIGLAVAVFSASSSFHDDIAIGTASLALSKPISRFMLLLGKWLGVVFVLGRFVLINTIFVMLSSRVSERIEDGVLVTDKLMQFLLLLAPVLAILFGGIANRFYRKSFVRSAIDAFLWIAVLLLVLSLLFTRTWHFSVSLGNISFRAVNSAVLIFCALCVYAALGVALSSRLKMAMVALISFVFMFAGLSADYLADFGILRFLLCVVPSLANFWICDVISMGYVAKVALYALSFVVFYLSFGMMLFNRKDLP